MKTTKEHANSPWLLLAFTLPALRASERVQIWRKLQRFGAIPFRNAGFLLPSGSLHLERFEWIATSVRGHGGEASILHIHAIEDLSPASPQEAFRKARAVEYNTVIENLARLPTPISSAQRSRLQRRIEEISQIDFFSSPLRAKAEEALRLAQTPPIPRPTIQPSVCSQEYRQRIWITRPRPGIDRVASAWLIHHSIDPGGKFLFATDPAQHPAAVPFDMYQPGGFGHQGDRCTFETLCLSFGLQDPRILQIGEAVHDADLEDAKFGRPEANILQQVLKGWATQDIPDSELLRRGMDLLDGLFHSIPESPTSSTRKDTP